MLTCVGVGYGYASLVWLLVVCCLTFVIWLLFVCVCLDCLRFVFVGRVGTAC